MQWCSTNEAHIIPALLFPGGWRGASFGKLKALRDDGKPRKQWRNRDAVFTHAAQGIRATLWDVQHLMVNLPATIFLCIWNIPYLRDNSSVFSVPIPFNLHWSH